MWGGCFYVIEFAFYYRYFSADPAMQLDVKFDERLKCLTVDGWINNVEVATKFIKANYIDVIRTDTLQIMQPGHAICCLCICKISNSVRLCIRLQINSIVWLKPNFLHYAVAKIFCFLG